MADVEKREYYRHRISGQKGYLVQVDGELLIRLDRGPNSPEQKFVRMHWVPDFERHTHTVMGVARVAYEADVSFCAMMHIKQGKKRPEWGSLSQKTQAYWARTGPQEPDRRELWLAVMGVMLGYTNDGHDSQASGDPA